MSLALNGRLSATANVAFQPLDIRNDLFHVHQSEYSESALQPSSARRHRTWACGNKRSPNRRPDVLKGWQEIAAFLGPPVSVALNLCPNATTSNDCDCASYKNLSAGDALGAFDSGAIAYGFDMVFPSPSLWSEQSVQSVGVGRRST
jgi:hypothetical protein